MAALATKILGGGILDSIPKIIDSIRGKSPEDAAKLQELTEKYKSDLLAHELEMAKLQAAEYQAQSDVNLQEAKSDSIFVAGWRPAIGWICGVGLLTEFLIRPFAIWIAALCGKVVDFPALDTGTLLTLLFGMLGMGYMRTQEKIQLKSNSVGH